MSLSEKLNEVDRLRRLIEEHGSLGKEVLGKINRKFRLEWNYYSNRMEGNTLTMEETKSVMSGILTIQGKPLKDLMEMKGHDEAIQSIMKMGKGDMNISKSRIRELHRMIMYGESAEQQEKIGRWKTEPNHVINYKNEKFEFTPPQEVPDALHELINWLNAEKEKIRDHKKGSLHPALLAFRFHLRYLKIHPFYDGNGRTARLLTNIILVSNGFPPIYIKEDEEKKTYYRYLADIQGYEGDEELLFEFLADRLIRSLRMVLDAIDGKEIEEPADWEKRLALLNNQLSEDDVKIEADENVINTLLDQGIFPMLERLTQKLGKFDHLFSQRDLLLQTQTRTEKFRSFEDLKSGIRSLEKKSQDFLIIVYSLHGFKRNGANIFSVSITINLHLNKFTYQFYLASANDRKDALKLYHQFFSEEEMETFANQAATIIMDQIESNLKNNRS